MHRSTSLPDLAETVAAVHPARRRAVAHALVVESFDRAGDPRLDAAGEILLDERRAPGSRRAEADRLGRQIDELDRAANSSRLDGDHAGYVVGFQAARALSALLFLVRDGAEGLADIAYEAVMVCGATEPVLAELVSDRR